MSEHGFCLVPMLAEVANSMSFSFSSRWAMTLPL